MSISGFFPEYFPGYFTGYFPDADGTSIATPEPVIFDVEMAEWLAGWLGVNCWPLKIPQEVTDYPALTYTLVDGESNLLLSGPAGQAWRSYQFDCYAADYAEAIALDDQLRRLLQPFKGLMGQVQVIEFNRHRPSNFYTTPPDGSDDGIYRHMSEYTVWYFEPLP